MSARRLLQLLLLVQALAAGAIAWAAVRWLGATLPQAILAGMASVVLVRLAINANNFLMSARASSPTPDAFRLGWMGRLRLFGEEFGASMRNSSWSMPRASACRSIHPGSASPPVLLLHGYGCNSGYWSRLMPMLDAAGISYAALDLSPIGGDIDGYVPTVEEAARGLLAATGASQLAIVAHSMGGLVARAWLRVHGPSRVARIITLGTPHHGTSLADRAPGINARQMRRSAGAKGGADVGAGDWLQALGDSEDMRARALITSIYTHHDNIVAPQTSSHLPGARNIEFGGIGHVALGSNARILAQVMRELAAFPPAAGSAPP